MHKRPLTSQTAAGMTLVELMIVLVIIAILTAVAWPAYQDSVRKGRRAAAMTLVAQLMQQQERIRSNSATYDETLTLAPAGGYYTASIVSGSVSPTGYTVRAVAVSGTPQAADARCGSFLAVVSSGSITYQSKTSGGALNASPDPCWVQ